MRFIVIPVFFSVVACVAIALAESDVSACDPDLEMLVRVAPNYPRTPLAPATEGYVVLEFLVTADGTVEDVAVVESTGGGFFYRSAIRAIKRWRYEPRGRPCRHSVRMEFLLDDS